MGEFHSINIKEMTRMLADNGEGRRMKRMWRSDYLTDHFHNAVSYLNT
jgi:hypothetical protein